MVDAGNCFSPVETCYELLQLFLYLLAVRWQCVQYLTRVGDHVINFRLFLVF